MKLMPELYTQIDFDSVAASERAARVMREKKCLRDMYVELYQTIMALRTKWLRDDGSILEIGSGGGCLKDLYPNAITSDIKKLSSVDLVINAEILPFAANSLDAILAVHVIHHIPDITLFLREADRVLKAGGGIICVEPYWSPVARFMYSYMHPEPYDTQSKQWQLDTSHPMTSSNQALSYLLLKRDKRQFETMFPQLKLIYSKSFGFIRYIMTGGIWLEQKLPDFMFPTLKYVEYLLQPLMPLLALNHLFVWQKTH